MGKHWAIETGARVVPVEYVCGTDPREPAETAEAAERLWRRKRKLFFLKIIVRRTTEEEDANLSDRE